MDELDEEVYSTIFNALRHGVRRNILRMLEEREHSFTDIEEKLDLSSSHLTYHLDSLKELITKKDTGYKLSVFGRAAVEMIKQVEDPHMEPSKIERNHRILMLVLVIGIIITSSLFTSNYYQLIKIKEQLDIQIQKVESLEMQLSPLSSLSGELKTRPFTHFSTGIYAVSSTNLTCQRACHMMITIIHHSFTPYFTLLWTT
jgi:DNA-binding HxlR family transcriptional regulator